MTTSKVLTILDEIAEWYFKANCWKRLDAIHAAQAALRTQQEPESNPPLTLDEKENY